MPTATDTPPAGPVIAAEEAVAEHDAAALAAALASATRALQAVSIVAQRVGCFQTRAAVAELRECLDVAEDDEDEQRDLAGRICRVVRRWLESLPRDDDGGLLATLPELTVADEV